MTFRSRPLLDLAKLAPVCFDCMRPNDGTVVAAHSNSQRHGKGLGLKAGDNWICYICFSCHSAIDQGSETRDARLARWEAAHIRSMDWAWGSGLICVAGAPEPSEAASAPKRKVSRSRPIASRGFDRSKSRGFDGKVREK